jgi:CRISPR-associated protein Csx3
VVVSVKEAGDLSEEHKAQMHAAYKRSLLTYPPGFRPLAYGEFCQTLEAESRSRFHTLTYHDKIVSFLRMDPTPEGYYMASVNTSALANGFGIGTPWLKGVLDLYADQNISLAYVEGNEQIARLYQNLGFGPAGSVENAGNSGTKVYKMTNSFSMKPDFMGEFLVLEVGFNMNVRTTGDKVLKDAMAGLHGLDLGSGSIIGINGRCSLLAAAAMSQNLKERFDTVAFWNPTLSTYLVGVSENPEVPPGSLISTDGIVSSPAAGIGDSYLIKRVNDSSDGATILSIGFNPEIGADPGQVLVDAIAALDKVDLKGGKLVKLNGMASLPIIASLTDRLSRNYDAIAVYDPKIPGDEKYVITHTKTREYTFGEKIP